jgi:hypothetical protein
VLEKSEQLDQHLADSIAELKTNPPANQFIETGKPMSITGLQEGAFQGKLAEMRKRIAATQEKALANIDGVVSAGEAKLEEAAKAAAAKAQSEIDNALQEFGLTTNGGPV